LSRSKTAARLDVGTERIRTAERSGLAGLRSADSKQGCGLRSGAGRNAAAERLADGSAPNLTPLAVTGSSPALVSTDKLDRSKVLNEHAASGRPDATEQPRRAGLLPTAGDDGSSVSTAVWAALLAGLLPITAVGVLLLWRRRTTAPDGYSKTPAVYPYGWGSDTTNRPPVPEPPTWPRAPRADSGLAPPSAGEDAAGTSSPPAAPAGSQRRARATRAFGGLAAFGAGLSLVLARLSARRRRR
jgi:hypothetical protein